MQESSGPLLIKDALFHPFRGLKHFNPSFPFLLLIIVGVTFFAVFETFERPRLSFEYAASLITTIAIQSILFFAVTLFCAAIYSYISYLIFKERRVNTWFNLIVISSLPTALLGVLKQILLLMEFDLGNMDFQIGSAQANLSYNWLGVISIIWGTYILAGGIKAKFSISATKAVLLAILLSSIPIVLFLLTMWAGQPISA